MFRQGLYWRCWVTRTGLFLLGFLTISTAVYVAPIWRLGIILDKTNIVFEGDSLIVGSFLTDPVSEGFPAQTIAHLPGDPLWANLARKGDSIRGMVEEGENQADSLVQAIF